MGGTAIGGAFDYLLAQMPDRVAAAAPGGKVVDTYTETYPTNGSPLLCIGADFPTSGQAGSGTRAYVELGGQGVEEDFSIPCYAGCGTSAGADTSTSAQKLARDGCIAVYDALCALVASDLTLGGVLRDGRWAAIGPLLMTATTITAGKGTSRWCVLSFSIDCKNHYYPGATS